MIIEDVCEQIGITEETYHKSALYHQIVHMLIYGVPPYKIIKDLVERIDVIEREHNNYVSNNMQPFVLNKCTNPKIV